MGDWQGPRKAMASGFDFAPRVQLAHNKPSNLKNWRWAGPSKSLKKLEMGRALEKPWQTVETLRLGYSFRTTGLEP